MFKQCAVCEQLWDSREEFLDDTRVSLVGYQSDFTKLAAGIFLFNHHCGATLALPVEQFQSLYQGPLYTERKTGGPECPGHCLHNDNLSPCPARCECAWVREVLQIIKTYPGKQYSEAIHR